MLAELPGYTMPISALVFNPDGKLLASASGQIDSKIKLWAIPAAWTAEK
jgi:WD40 repeat protein